MTADKSTNPQTDMKGYGEVALTIIIIKKILFITVQKSKRPS